MQKHKLSLRGSDWRSPERIGDTEYRHKDKNSTNHFNRNHSKNIHYGVKENGKLNPPCNKWGTIYGSNY